MTRSEVSTTVFLNPGVPINLLAPTSSHDAYVLVFDYSAVSIHFDDVADLRRLRNTIDAALTKQSAKAGEVG
jgi:hypothetical protein